MVVKSPSKHGVSTIGLKLTAKNSAPSFTLCTAVEFVCIGRSHAGSLFTFFYHAAPPTVTNILFAFNSEQHMQICVQAKDRHQQWQFLKGHVS